MGLVDTQGDHFELDTDSDSDSEDDRSAAAIPRMKVQPKERWQKAVR
jgi:hypothetical protein